MAPDQTGPPVPGPTDTGARHTKKSRRPVRDNLEGIGIAILMACLLKPIFLEAYVIPTPSMQPTLMGSPEAGVFDRLIVDKFRYDLFEPKRWDIVVFRFPIRQNQNYVKRIVGMPAERLRIVCGNLYLLDDNNQPQQALRKPDDLQELLWREIYPARRLLEDKPPPLAEYWSQTGRWQEDGTALVATLSPTSPARLTFYDDRDGRCANRIYDGYPTAVARDIKGLAFKGEDRVRPDLDGVPDLRLTFDLVPDGAVDKLACDLEVSHSGQPKRFSLEVENGKGRLRVYLRGNKDWESEEFACPLPAGSATRISFARIDDEMIARRNGSDLLRVDSSRHRILTDVDPKNIAAAVAVTGSGRAAIEGLRLERDQHYTRSQLPVDHVIAVPPGHYFMMGDNTLQSADARDWRTVTVGVLPDGTICEPDRKKHPDARLLVGNQRPGNLHATKAEDIINDENPVIVRSRQRIAFTDLPGEVHVLKGLPAAAYTQENMLFGEQGREWKPPSQPVSFVPREHILGRPLLIFWPCFPFAHRLGFIR